MGLFQPWRLSEADKKKLGLVDVDFVKNPLLRIKFSIEKKPKIGGKNWRGGGSRGKNFAGERGSWRGGGARKSQSDKKILDVRTKKGDKE
jgi:deoxyribodipyrimidine photo-lyase